MARTREQLCSLVEPCVKAVELQLSLASRTSTDVLYKIWPLAYCYGAFEAVARRYDLDEVETYAVITLGLEELFLDGLGLKHFVRARQHHMSQNKFFVEGQAHGFDDFSRWMTAEDYRPLSLVNFFILGQLPPLA